MSTPDDKKLIEELERLAGEATPPPWEWVKRKSRPDTIHGKRRASEVSSELSPTHLLNVYGINGDPNGPLVVAAVNALPRLLSLAKIGVEAEGVLREVYLESGFLVGSLEGARGSRRLIREEVEAFLEKHQSPQPQPAEETKP